MPRIPSVAAFLDPENGYEPTEAERRLIKACQEGGIADISNTCPQVASHENTVRARIIRLLILGGTERCGLHESGVWLKGAWIVGELDLRFTTCRGRLRLEKCNFDKRPNLTQAKLDQFCLDGCKLPGLLAERILVRGSVYLRDLRSSETVDFVGASIGGQLVLNDSYIFNRDMERGKAINAQGISVEGSVLLKKVFVFGSIVLMGGKINGQLTCAESIVLGASKAINGQRLRIGQSLFLDDLWALGGVGLNSSCVKGNISATGSVLVGGDNFSLNASYLDVGQSLNLTNVISIGPISLRGAKVCAQLKLNEAEVYADQENFFPLGKDFPRRSSAICVAEALNFQSINVGSGVFLTNSLSRGAVVFDEARIGAQLCLRVAVLDGCGGRALSAKRMNVAHSLFFRKLNKVHGSVSFSSAHVANLEDDFKSWEMISGDLDIDGFTYDGFVGSSLDVAKRLEWVEKGVRDSGTCSPQPYTQLAKVLAAMGHKRSARRVLFQREVTLGEESRQEAFDVEVQTSPAIFKKPLAKVKFWGRLVGDGLSRLIVGYGHDPWRALAWMIVLWTISTLLAHLAWINGDFAPNSDVMLVSDGWLAQLETPNPAEAWSSKGAAGQDWESFNRYAWGLDLVVPILDIGQTDAWQPSRDRGPDGYRLWWARWLLQGMGWLVSALGVAAITGIMQKDRD